MGRDEGNDIQRYVVNREVVVISEHQETYFIIMSIGNNIDLRRLSQNNSVIFIDIDYSH